MMQIINVCLGTACPLATKCASSEFNEESLAPAGCWKRHYEPMVVGDHCAEFKPLPRRAWGEGRESCD